MTLHDQPAPVTERGRRTRAALLAAAQRVFEEKGYVEPRVSDIVAEAGVSHGTFYTYFESKQAIFSHLVEGVQAQFIESRTRGERGPGSATPYETILAANQAFLAAYSRNRKLMGIVEQVALFNAELKELRRSIRTQYVRRVQRSIVRLQEEGLADGALDPYLAASALGSMVDRSAYVWYVLGEPFDEQAAPEVLTRLWANALRLPTPD